MKLFNYLEKAVNPLNKVLGRILGDAWEVESKDVSAAKANEAANTFFENEILGGITEFIEYASDTYEQDEKGKKNIELAPKAKAFALSFIESLENRLAELKQELR